MVCFIDYCSHLLWILWCCTLVSCVFIALHSRGVQEFFEWLFELRLLVWCCVDWWWYFEWEASVALWLMLCCWILVSWSVCLVWVEPHFPCVRSLRVYDSLRARIAFREACDPPLWMVHVKYVELVSGAWECVRTLCLCFLWNLKKYCAYCLLKFCIQAQL